MIKFTYHQEFEGKIWTSETFTVAEPIHVIQGVTAGHLLGSARWATEVDTGRLLYALDRKGYPTKKVPA